MRLFNETYSGRRVLVTGHTGFKGSWLTLWLRELGADVFGAALSPSTSPSHWDLLELEIEESLIDIRDCDALSAALQAAQPEIVFHLAAQPLVRKSYRDPLETWSTNVMGTANLLETCRKTCSVRAIVIVTTDKVYENNEWTWGYREIDRLGGHDPYSSSKAAAELVVDSYRKSFFHAPQAPLVASARAGNVIGGGDWSEDRLIPDLVRSIASGELEIRSPEATRPWQHVLDCLSGYLLLGQALLERKAGVAESWNFGPDLEGNRSVSEVLNALGGHWPELQWRVADNPEHHEAGYLYLESSKARARLGWRPVWGIDEALAATAGWYQGYLKDGRVASREQLADYLAAALAADAPWCCR